MAKARGLAFQQILCPVDFSKHSLAALRRAIDVARRFGGAVTVLYVSDPLLEPAAAAAAYDLKSLKAKTDVELRDFIGRAKAGSVVVSAQTATGHPAPTIVRQAERLRADLIVLGSHGLTGPGKWMIGSTTERVLYSTKIPILVVPARGAGTIRPRDRAAASGTRVLIPVDVDDHRAADVRAALDVASALGARPTLLHVIQPPRLPDWLRADARRHAAGRLAVSHKVLQALAEAGGLDADCQSVVGDPVEQIAAAATRTGSELIITTLQRGSTLLGPRRGSITYRLVALAIAPVLALPARAGQRSR